MNPLLAQTMTYSQKILWLVFFSSNCVGALVFCLSFTLILSHLEARMLGQFLALSGALTIAISLFFSVLGTRLSPQSRFY